MSATSYPIPPDIFKATLETLELEQIHNESARLKNSIHHLELSNLSLEEFRDDPDCQQALVENEEVIRQQKDRISLIQQELERRGIRMGHANSEGPPKTNGHGASDPENSNRDESPRSGTADAQGDHGVYL